MKNLKLRNKNSLKAILEEEEKTFFPELIIHSASSSFIMDDLASVVAPSYGVDRERKGKKVKERKRGL